ncbi:uncharacterized protein LOC108606075 [Drosophila busckii]|uniref:uncharacterized protein LOC108606075 n=1 Tax=Drosophila busckii TaxID=30019 RepID=UPI00083EF102|nr:uncharacterized protein LOC108606075 [Drosophila busckii]
MTVTYMIPFPPGDQIVMDWDHKLDMSLFLPVGMLVIVILYMLYKGWEQMAPMMASPVEEPIMQLQQHWRLDEQAREAYKSYIFRRCLAQLDAALSLRPAPGEELNACMRARLDAEQAVRLFCVEMRKVLHPEQQLDELVANGHGFYVPAEQQAQLADLGYGNLHVELSDEFLESLVNPKCAHNEDNKCK